MSSEDIDRDAPTERIAPQTARVEETIAGAEAKDAAPVEPAVQPTGSHSRLVKAIPLAVAAVVICAVIVGGFAFSGQKADQSIPSSSTVSSTSKQPSQQKTSSGQETTSQDQSSQNEEQATSQDEQAGQSSSSGETNDTASSQGGSESTGGSSGSSEQTPQSDPNTITVSICIDGSRAGGQDCASMSTKQVTVSTDATVFDALLACGASYAGDSTYITAINGLAEKQCSGLSGWKYSVNGVYPNKSCGRYILSVGDSIVWKYVLSPNE